MFGNAPRSVWESWMPPDARGRVRLACRALLIEHGGQRILCETGIGAFFEPKLAERFGVAETEHVLLGSLARLGLSDADIDVVVLSHLHFDHAGGLLPPHAEIQAGRDRLLFPNARYVVSEAAYGRAKQPHLRDRASFIPGLVEKLDASGRLVVVTGEKASGVCEDRLSFFMSNGHTPGQMHAIFRGTHDVVVFAGDLIPGTAWVHAPITMGYDRYPEMLIDEKLALYDRVVAGRWRVFYTHDPAVAASEIERDVKGRFVPARPVPRLERAAL